MEERIVVKKLWLGWEMTWDTAFNDQQRQNDANSNRGTSSDLRANPSSPVPPCSLGPMPHPTAGQSFAGRVGDVVEGWRVDYAKTDEGEEDETESDDDDHGGPISAILAQIRRDLRQEEEDVIVVSD